MKHFATLLRRIAPLCILVLLGRSATAQTNISGIVNEYVAVTDMNINANSMAVSDITGFAKDDLVLIMQMKGASISTTDNNNFGTVSSFNGAGAYELATICNISGNEFTFESQLHGTYNPGSGIQIIKVAQYANATVNDTLTGQAWNGQTGGVLAVKVNGTLTLNAPVLMDGKGYRGASFENSVSNTCGYLTNRTGFVYDSPDMGAPKGEGIAQAIIGMEYGRGPFGSGGGGGNDFNSGGGGGGNAGAGGLGGENQDPNILNCKGYNSGYGGKDSRQVSRLFMGGGGGAGHGDDGSGTSGANGGGIIILVANRLTSGTSALISSKGMSANSSTSDGAGGGGAGGSIHMIINNFTGTQVLDVMGGAGGDANNESLNRCFGPGGGGGGGMIKISPQLPTGVTTNVQGGDNGNSVNTTNFTCNANSSVGAQKGGSGQVVIDLIPEGNIPSITCGVLPVEWIDFSITEERGAHLIQWTTGFERNNAFFTVERSLDGAVFQPLTEVVGNGTTQESNTYSWLDEHPSKGISFYRIKQTDVDGEYTYSNTLSITNKTEFDLRVYPNPWVGGQDLQMDFVLPESGEVQISLFDPVGRLVYKGSDMLQAGVTTLSLPEQELLPGYYLLKIGYQQKYYNEKLVIQR